MKFQFYLPERKEKQAISDRFLPSIAFVIFSNKGESDKEVYKGIYSRRIPQYMKIKLDLIGRFRSNFILPLDKTEGTASYLKTKPQAPWTEPQFIKKFERFDYMIGGTVSLDEEMLLINLYSYSDDAVIFEKTYHGNSSRFPEFISDFFMEMLRYFEVILEDKEKQILMKAPTADPEAFEYLLQALEKDPANPVNTDDGEAYESLLIKALEKDPKSEEIASMIVNYAELKSQNRDNEKADLLVKKVIQLQPSHRDAVLLSVKLLLKADNTDQALNLLDESIKNNPKLNDLPLTLALESMYSDSRENTILLFEKALDCEPNNPEVYDNFGYYLASIGKIDLALSIFKHCLTLFPDREYPLINAAQISAQLGLDKQADQYYLKAKTLYSNSPKLLASLAVYRTILKDETSAKKLINEALEISPENTRINLIAASIYENFQDYDEAKRLAKTAIDLEPISYLSEEARYFYSRVAAGISEEQQQNNRELFLDAVLLMKKNETAKALEIIEKVVYVEPHYWRALFIKGVAHRLMGDYEKALEAFNQVDELFEDQISLHNEMGKCYMALDQFHQAFLHILYAFRKNPHDPEIMGNMALVYMRMGRLQEAEVLLKQIKIMDPNNKNIDIYLKELERIKRRKRSSRGNGGGH